MTSLKLQESATSSGVLDIGPINNLEARNLTVTARFLPLVARAAALLVPMLHKCMGRVRAIELSFALTVQM